MLDWLRESGVTLRGGGVDESPHCYKRISEVLAHHQSTTNVINTLVPLGVAMAGTDMADPYRD